MGALLITSRYVNMRSLFLVLRAPWAAIGPRPSWDRPYQGLAMPRIFSRSLEPHDKGRYHAVMNIAGHIPDVGVFLALEPEELARQTAFIRQRG
jgi:hypothetical protein